MARKETIIIKVSREEKDNITANAAGLDTSVAALIRLSYKQWMVKSNHEWKNLIKKRDHYTCQDCGFIGQGNSIDAHHIDRNPARRLDASNGIALCKKCHTKADALRKQNNAKRLFEAAKVIILSNMVSRYKNYDSIDIFTLKQVSEMMQCSSRTLTRLIDSKKLIATKEDIRWQISKKNLESFAARYSAFNSYQEIIES